MSALRGFKIKSIVISMRNVDADSLPLSPFLKPVIYCFPPMTVSTSSEQETNCNRGYYLYCCAGNVTECGRNSNAGQSWRGDT